MQSEGLPHSASDGFQSDNELRGELRSLAEAIVEARAVVYVGAGVSAAAGLPTWTQLLEELYRDGAMPLLAEDKAGQQYLKSKIVGGQSLEAADLLQDVLDNELESLLERKFKLFVKPSEIHLNLARIPFKMAITTNYDRLLEGSFARPRKVLTWMDAKDVLHALQINQFVLLKLHGEIGRQPSLILGGRQYRDLIYGSPLFWQVLKWIFMTRTCLFVGAGLGDADLLQMFHEAMSEAGSRFGPHYALIPEDEAPPLRVEYLLQSMRIKVIRLTKRADDPVKGKRWIEKAASRVLVELSGDVAKLFTELKPPPLPSSESPDFYLQNALASLIEKAVVFTGSFRGDICLSPNGKASHLRGQLEYYVAFGLPMRDLQRGTNGGKKVPMDSICGIAYYRSGERGLYVRDVQHGLVDGQSEVGDYGQIDFEPGHTEVNSALAVPIEVDGLRVGVLNVEARTENAYSDGHNDALLWFANKAGQLYSAAQEHELRGRKIQNELVEEIFDDLRRLLCHLDDVVAHGGKSGGQAANNSLVFVIYQADYRNGMIRAQSLQKTIYKQIPDRERPEDPPTLSFPFKVKSMGTSILRYRSAFVCWDYPAFINADESGRGWETDLSGHDWKEILRLREAVLAFPLYVGGYIAGGICLWKLRDQKLRLNWRHLELFRRAMHLILNSGEAVPPSDGNRLFKSEIDQARKDIDHASAVVSLFLPVVNKSSPVWKTDGDIRLFKSPLLADHWEKLAERMAGLVALFHERYGASWEPPRRASLFLRTEPPENSPARTVSCIMALTVELSQSGNHDLSGVASLTLNGTVFAVSGDWPPGSLARKAWAPVQRIAYERTVSPERLTGDSHLSFLLDTLGADRFARPVLPDGGDDRQAYPPERNRSEPSYAVPIVAVSEGRHPPSRSVHSSVLECEKDVPHKILRSFVGYITLDSGSEPNPGGKVFGMQNVAAQNDLLHTLDLFSGLLAETDLFRKLYNQFSPTTPLC